MNRYDYTTEEPVESSDMQNMINGTLAIKAHATRIKVLTVGRQHDEVMSQKTSSTHHTSLQCQ